MNDLSTFQRFLETTTPSVNVWTFLVDLTATMFICFLLGRAYVKYGRSLTNRSELARNFVMVGMTTMMIIAIVKSSLALSLGLVGALSIVRFRTAIKEPEELAYLFLTIGIGLGFGANQRAITITAVFLVFLVILVSHCYRRDNDHANLLVNVRANVGQLTLDEMVQLLKDNCRAVDLKRFDESADSLDASFMVEFDTLEQLTRGKDSLKSRGDSVQVTFVDTAGIM